MGHTLCAAGCVSLHLPLPGVLRGAAAGSLDISSLAHWGRRWRRAVPARNEGHGAMLTAHTNKWTSRPTAQEGSQPPMHPHVHAPQNLAPRPDPVWLPLTLMQLEPLPSPP